MTAITHTPLHVKNVSSVKTEIPAVVNLERDLRSRLEAGLKEIRKELDEELELSDPEDQLIIELRVWVDNFLYFLNLEAPEVGLKTYIPLLLDILEGRYADTWHPVIKKVDAWLKSPDVHTLCQPLLEERRSFSRFHPLPRHPSRLVQNYCLLDPLLLPLRSDRVLRLLSVEQFSGISVRLPYDSKFIRFLVIRQRICKQPGRVDLVHEKMGKTSWALQEHIFTFLDLSNLRNAMAVCKDFFRRCHVESIFKAVRIPELQRNHPGLSKEKNTAELDQTVEQLKTLVDEIQNSKEALDASSNSDEVIRARAFGRNLLILRDHLSRASKKFPLELLLFRAATTRLLNSRDEQ